MRKKEENKERKNEKRREKKKKKKGFIPQCHNLVGQSMNSSCSCD
jgi:hypothetical protein